MIEKVADEIAALHRIGWHYGPLRVGWRTYEWVRRYLETGVGDPHSDLFDDEPPETMSEEAWSAYVEILDARIATIWAGSVSRSAVFEFAKRLRPLGVTDPFFRRAGIRRFGDGELEIYGSLTNELDCSVNFRHFGFRPLTIRAPHDSTYRRAQAGKWDVATRVYAAGDAASSGFVGLLWRSEYEFGIEATTIVAAGRDFMDVLRRTQDIFTEKCALYALSPAADSE